jgi:3-oxoacyl-[acyl-carrier protein] reductase
MNSQARVALVTGGGGGIGAATCRVLASKGFFVMVCDADGPRSDECAAGLLKEGLRARAVQLDVTDQPAVTRLADAVANEFGRIDALVNMAGIVRNALVTKIFDQDFELTLATHVQGTLNCMRAVAPKMRSAGYGRIINTSSVAVLGSVGGGSYGAAKAAIEALSRTAALEWATHGITVNCVAPGLISAGMFLTVPQEFQRSGIERTPMKRAGTAEEVAECIAFFASPQASFVTGQTLFVCGGLSIGF